ncbi:hypothetical protein [Sutcliffiella sp. NC1]|uniref:hypothetical protein n=1 Tax=Sutcliffiella sp. NC1 TaxID=3004096 RepID=UPI0022DD1926|nr:hypothetical protein [Sutcliffiella sp. NC1]WBL16859.1 hypothetical protein O1A01_09570 [Sutcliffiella sp. NC1]
MTKEFKLIIGDPRKEAKNVPFCLSYVNKLSFTAMYGDSDLQDKFDLTEINEWNDNGGLCIYTSVLLYCLLSITDSRGKVEYVQGFFHFDGIYNMMFSEGTMGLHAFLVMDKYVIDVFIQQLQDYFLD